MIVRIGGVKIPMRLTIERKTEFLRPTMTFTKMAEKREFRLFTRVYKVRVLPPIRVDYKIEGE